MSSPNPSSSPFMINADCMREISSYYKTKLHMNPIDLDISRLDSGLHRCITMMIRQALQAKKSLAVSREIFNTPSEMWCESIVKLFTNAGYKVYPFDDIIVIEW